MKQNRSTLMLIVLAIVVAIGLPYYISSQKAAALDARTVALRLEEKGFKEKSLVGERVRKQTADWTKVSETIASSMPADPDIQGAIRTIQRLTEGDVSPDHVRWIQASVSNLVVNKAPEAPKTTTTVAKSGAKPAPVAAPKPASSIPAGGFDMNISVEGSRAKVLAFVTKIQQEPLVRLFAVRSVSLTNNKAAAAGGAASPVTTVAVEGNVMVTASIRLGVITFGVTPADAVVDPTTAKSPVPAGPAPAPVDPTPAPSNP
jgi:hypothetical protein